MIKLGRYYRTYQIKQLKKRYVHVIIKTTANEGLCVTNPRDSNCIGIVEMKFQPTLSLVRGWSNAGYEEEHKETGSSTFASQRFDSISIHDINL